MSDQHQPSRRSVAKGAAWTLPVLTVVGAAPAYAQSTSAFSQDLRVRKVSNSGTGNQLAKTIVYEFRNLGPGTTTAPAVWLLNITQTEGEAAGRQRFEEGILDGGTGVLSEPVYSTLNGYHVTNQTFTLAAGTPASGTRADFSIKINFPNSLTEYDDAGWTVTITPRFNDINGGNNFLVDLQ